MSRKIISVYDQSVYIAQAVRDEEPIGANPGFMCQRCGYFYCCEQGKEHAANASKKKAQAGARAARRISR